MSELLKGSFKQGERVIELDENDTPIAISTPTVLIDESPEDAALRRQMLQYNMAEVGNIVAELDLEEEIDSDYDEEYSDSERDDEVGSTSSAEEEENEFGVGTQSMLSDEYRKQMAELENRLNAQMLQNMGPESPTTDDKAREELAKGARYLRVLSDEHIQPAEEVEATEGSAAKDKPKSKSVRFASELDVAPAPSLKAQPTSTKPQTSSKPRATQSQPTATAVHETITERRNTPTTPTPPAPASTSKTKPPSRFKAARASAIQSTPSIPPALPTQTPAEPQEQPSTRRPTGPANAIVALTLIERPPSKSSSKATPPAEPDEFDPDIMRQEVAREYYAQRNRIVQKEGGFLRFRYEGAESSMPEEDERGLDQQGGAGERVSLFKAARLMRGGGGAV